MFLIFAVDWITDLGGPYLACESYFRYPDLERRQGLYYRKWIKTIVYLISMYDFQGLKNIETALLDVSLVHGFNFTK